MELAGLLLRVVVSLGLVLAVLWFAAKGLRSSQRRSRAGVDVDVLTRQPLAQKSSLAVVRLGERALVLGVTESRVELLHETALSDVLVPYQPSQPQAGQVDQADQLDAARGLGAGAPALPGALGRGHGTDVPASSEPRTRGAWSSNGAARPSVLKGRGVASASGEGPLAGSALSPQTWSRAVQVLREKTVRK